MRLIRIVVPEDRRGAVTETLDEMGLDYAVTGDEREGTLTFEFPIPPGAANEALGRLRDAGVDQEETYTVIDTAEAALTPNSRSIQERYGSTYNPLPQYELRGKLRSISQDTFAYLALIFLSSVIAAVGLLIDSPAIVVGSMVVAPIVGPILTASAGATIGERAMVSRGIQKQVWGLVAGVGGAFATSLALRWLSLLPNQLAISSIELISLRIAPGAAAVTVGLAAGAAAAFGLTTEGPIAIVGVMVAAALIPAAATAGIGLAWTAPLVVIGSVLVLASTVVAIHLGVVVTLVALGYRPSLAELRREADRSLLRTVGVALGALALAVAVGLTGVATYEQIQYQQEVNRQVEAALAGPAYGDAEVVSVSVEFGYPVAIAGSETVTVTLTRSADATYPGLAERLRDRIAARTTHSPTVRVRYVEYDRAVGADEEWIGGWGRPFGGTFDPFVAVDRGGTRAETGTGTGFGAGTGADAVRVGAETA